MTSKSSKKTGGRDLQNPVKNCPPVSLVVQVDSVNRDQTNTPVADVKAEILNGPTKPGPKKTSSKGTAVFPGLQPGGYEVGIKVEGAMARFYDLNPPPSSESEDVNQDGVLFRFVLRHYWIQARVLWADGKPAKGLPFSLKLKAMKGGALDKNWTKHYAGKTAEADYNEEYVPKGRYQLLLPEITNARWGAAKIVVGEAVELNASVFGVDVGTAGQFSIYDARDLTKPLDTANTQVSDSGAGKELKSSWTPQKDKLKTFLGSLITFQAKTGDASGYSSPALLTTKEKFEVVDSTGKNVDGHLSLYYSGGTRVEADAVGGQADVFSPWAQSLTRIQLTGQPRCVVTLEEDGVAARGLVQCP